MEEFLKNGQKNPKEFFKKIEKIYSVSINKEAQNELNDYLANKAKHFIGSGVGTGVSNLLLKNTISETFKVVNNALVKQGMKGFMSIGGQQFMKIGAEVTVKQVGQKITSGFVTNVMKQGGKVVSVEIGKQTSKSILSGLAKGFGIGLLISGAVGSIKASINEKWDTHEEIILENLEQPLVLEIEEFQKQQEQLQAEYNEKEYENVQENETYILPSKKVNISKNQELFSQYQESKPQMLPAKKVNISQNYDLFSQFQEEKSQIKPAKKANIYQNQELFWQNSDYYSSISNQCSRQILDKQSFNSNKLQIQQKNVNIQEVSKPQIILPAKKVNIFQNQELFSQYSYDNRSISTQCSRLIQDKQNFNSTISSQYCSENCKNCGQNFIQQQNYRKIFDQNFLSNHDKRFELLNQQLEDTFNQQANKANLGKNGRMRANSSFKSSKQDDQIHHQNISQHQTNQYSSFKTKKIFNNDLNNLLKN